MTLYIFFFFEKLDTYIIRNNFSVTLDIYCTYINKLFQVEAINRNIPSLNYFAL